MIVQYSDEFESHISSLVQALPEFLQPRMHLIPKSDVHISVSRTVAIRHYWIEPLVEQLRCKLDAKERFVIK